jgi:hypothetical protein
MLATTVYACTTKQFDIPISGNDEFHKQPIKPEPSGDGVPHEVKGFSEIPLSVAAN